MLEKPIRQRAINKIKAPESVRDFDAESSEINCAAQGPGQGTLVGPRTWPRRPLPKPWRRINRTKNAGWSSADRRGSAKALAGIAQ